MTQEQKRLRQIELLEKLKLERQQYENQLKITKIRCESIQELINDTNKAITNAENEMREML